MTDNFLVVTDLDGTLLDHHDYSLDAASEALAMLKARQIPLVLCSSKTAAEIQPLWESLALDAPFIVENGAAIYLPGSEGGTDMVSFGVNRTDVLRKLASIGDEESFRYTGFSEMSVKDVMAATGLDETGAANALQREFTEPLLWQDTEAGRVRFLKALHKAGLEAVQGGRFMHVSAGCDKGRAVDWLRRWYRQRYGSTPIVIALGDSDNDVTMLERADLPVIVKSPVKDYPPVNHAAVSRTQLPGPAGWNEAILNILEPTTGNNHG